MHALELQLCTNVLSSCFVLNLHEMSDHNTFHRLSCFFHILCYFKSFQKNCMSQRNWRDPSIGTNSLFGGSTNFQNDLFNTSYALKFIRNNSPCTRENCTIKFKAGVKCRLPLTQPIPPLRDLSKTPIN